MSRANLSSYSKLDPAHVLDGLFVPRVQKGHALYDVEGPIDGGIVRFKGVQLGVSHQSLLLAIVARTARLGADALVVKGRPGDLHALLSKQLVLKGKADEEDFSQIECSAYALLKDADLGTSEADYEQLVQMLHDLSTVVMYREKNGQGGTSRMLGFRHEGQHLSITLNWRLTAAMFGGQNIHVSLHERRELSSSSVGKILHTWFSAAIRPGGRLMAGRGADLDTLIRHVYGKRPCSPEVIRKRRAKLLTALEAIGRLHGWIVTVEGSRVYVSRPRLLGHDDVVSPGDLDEAEAMLVRDIQGDRAVPPSPRKTRKPRAQKGSA